MTTALSPQMSSGPSMGPKDGPTASAPPKPQPPAAAPPSKIEIERKLSFKSAAKHRVGDSPKKPKNQAPPSSYPLSGNDSDTSSVSYTSTQPTQVTSPTFPASPLLTPATTSGLSSIAEREKRRAASAGVVLAEEMDTTELEDVEEEGAEDGDGDLDGDGEGEESDDAEAQGGELQRGMEGERMVKSGFLYKKQERRKAWKKKWFVLRTGKLAYYKDEREYSLRKVIDLKTIQTVAPVTVKKHPFTFGIVTPKRTFFAKALSQDEMDDWVRTINTARRKLSEREEEERNRKTGTGGSITAGISKPDRKSSLDEYGAHTLYTPAGSVTASPVAATGGHFGQLGSSIASGPSKAIGIPGQTQGEYNLTSQMAKMNIPASISPTISTMPRLPSQRIVSGTSSRRDPSASSYTSSTAQDYFGPSSLNNTLSNSGSTWGQQVQPSSDDDESFSDNPPQTAAVGSNMSTQPSLSLAIQSPTPVDPKKIILQAYLMKRSKGRGRKVWRKRWFFLTSQGLTYTKSHMDSRPLRFIPLTNVLDAIEVSPEDEDVSDGSDSDVYNESGYTSPALTRQFTGTRKQRKPDDARPEKPGIAENEHLFRLITAKRTFVLCAPSEEDEIKWLAAFRALLNRERDRGRHGSPATSPTIEGSGRFGMAQHQALGQVPMITQQPPTPAALPVPVRQGGEGPTVPAIPTSQGPPVTEGSTGNTQGPGMRARSATYIAKGAVADVTRRFHPEQAGQ